MVDSLTDKMHREWNVNSADANHVNHSLGTRHLSQIHPLSRKISDHNGHHNSQHHRQSNPSPPTITTTDYSDPSSLSVMRASQFLSNHRNLDAGYDTDGGIGTTPSTSKSHRRNAHAIEHFVSPRLPTKRSVRQTPKQLPIVPSQQHLSHDTYLAVHSPSAFGQHHDERSDEPIEEGHTHRHHIRLSRRVHHRSPSTIPRHSVLANTISGRPFRLIFMRHSERANQALGSDWFSKAFRTNTYKAYDPNLPMVLPKGILIKHMNSMHHSQVDYEIFSQYLLLEYFIYFSSWFKSARHTGRVMLNSNLRADVCLSSTALRCIQTAERLLTGMDRDDHVAIRIEPGLFECPHLNYKLIDSFMTKKELIDNGYNIKHEYRPLIPKLSVPESLNEYFDRCVTVMRGILDRYGLHGGTVLIVTHAPGLLALTDAIKGKRPDHDTFYRTVAAYPPLATYIAEYDGTKWNHSDEPFSITPLAK